MPPGTDRSFDRQPICSPHSPIDTCRTECRKTLSDCFDRTVSFSIISLTDPRRDLGGQPKHKMSSGWQKLSKTEVESRLIDVVVAVRFNCCSSKRENPQSRLLASTNLRTMLASIQSNIRGAWAVLTLVALGHSVRPRALLIRDQGGQLHRISRGTLL
jgi:hypothetical protein